MSERHIVRDPIDLVVNYLYCNYHSLKEVINSSNTNFFTMLVCSGISSNSFTSQTDGICVVKTKVGDPETLLTLNDGPKPKLTD